MPDFGSNVHQMEEFSKLLQLGLSKVYKQIVPPQQKLFGAWLQTVTADEWIEDELQTTGFATMPTKVIGGAFQSDKILISDPKLYEMLTYGLAAVMEYELVRWDKYGVFRGIMRKMKRSGTERQNVVAYAIPNNAFSTADATYTTYAGEALISPTHTLLRGGTGKNAPAVAVDLTYLGMQEADIDFMNTVDEDGLYALLTASTLMVSTAKKWIAETLLKSTYRPDNANMAHSTTKDSLNLHVSPYLTAPGTWFELCDKSQLYTKFRMGDDLELRKYFDGGTWNNVFTLYGSWTVAVFTWHGWWGSQGV